MRFVDRAALYSLALAGMSLAPLQASAGGAQPDRAAAVKQVFQESYADYLKYAAPSDLLLPYSEKGLNNSILNGWGGSIIDGMDTMLLMGLNDLYAQALDHVAKVDFTKTCCGDLSLFETTIRYVGGMMSAYELNGRKDEILLNQTKVLTDGLAYAWHGNDRLPYNTFNLNTRTPDTSSNQTGIAVAGSLILEFATLSKYSGNQTYVNLTDKAMKAIIESPAVFPGLYAQAIDVVTEKPLDDYVTWGGGSDSFFEYLLKYAYLSGNEDPAYLDTWKNSVKSSMENIIVQSGVGNHTYLSDYTKSGGGQVYTFSHLGCFAAGNWALGGQLLKDPQITEYGLRLVEACYNTYAGTATGIGPEVFGYIDKNGKSPGNNVTASDIAFNNLHGYFITTADYLLRPEVLESIFYAYRITGDSRYQDWAWNAFNAIKKWCKAPAAWSSINDVNQTPPPALDDSESFFYAETLKYLYLIFSDASVIDLDKYVFNTECHPYELQKTNPMWGKVQFNNNPHPPKGFFNDNANTTSTATTKATPTNQPISKPANVIKAVHSGIANPESVLGNIVGHGGTAASAIAASAKAKMHRHRRAGQRRLEEDLF